MFDLINMESTLSPMYVCKGLLCSNQSLKVKGAEEEKFVFFQF